MSEKNPLVINLMGGPGVGKTILTLELCAKLKRMFISCDISREYIKGKLRQQAKKAVSNQQYIYGKQQFEQYTLRDEVDVIVTDSPILFPAMYDSTQCPFLKGLALKEFNSYENLTYYIERDMNVPYEQEGRYQDIEGAKKVDLFVKKFLDDNNVAYKVLYGIDEKSMGTIINDIEKSINIIINEIKH